MNGDGDLNAAVMIIRIAECNIKSGIVIIVCVYLTHYLGTLSIYRGGQLPIFFCFSFVINVWSSFFVKRREW